MITKDISLRSGVAASYLLVNEKIKKFIVFSKPDVVRQNGENFFGPFPACQIVKGGVRL
jgi:hypothetical protein